VHLIRLGGCAAERTGLGYDLIVSPLSGLFAATKALAGAYRTLHDEGTLRDHLDQVVGFEEFGEVVGLEDHYDIEARYAQSSEGGEAGTG
jgi:2-methylisocitrate lyase-like PEP mutase family enzyme